MDNFEEFHITRIKKDSKRILELFVSNGIRAKMSELNEIGLEYLISVHPDDIEAANKLFYNDLGQGKRFTSQ